MAHHETSDEATTIFPSTNVWILVLTVLALGALVFGITLLHESGLVRSSAELAWATSQDMSDIEAERFADASTAVLLSHESDGFGRPDYELELLGSGSARFTGRRYVCEVAPAPIAIGRTDLGRVVGGIIAVDQAGGFTFPYPGPIDATYATITLRSTHHTASVTFPRRYRSDRKLLDDIAERIDAIGGSTTWVGEWHDYRRVCRQADGTLRPVPGTE